MLDFLRMLAPQHADALKPASALRRPAASDGQLLPVDENNGPFAVADLPDIGQAGSSADRARRPSTARHDAASPAEADSRAPVAVATVELHQTINPATRDESPLAAPTGRVDVGGPLCTTPRLLDAASPLTNVADTFQSESRQSPRRDPHPIRAGLNTWLEPPDSPHPPLSPATVALYGIPSAERESPPAIHVTIDRIEVRAPAAASKSPAARKQSAAATQSLSDYLSGNRTRTR